MKIAILSLWTDEIQAYAIPVNKIREKYCERHNYALITLDHSLDLSRVPAWSKFKLILHEIPNYDYLFWNDADCIIVDHDIPLEDFIDAHFLFQVAFDGDQHWRHPATDYVSPGINTGNMLIQANSQSEYWLNYIYNATSLKKWHHIPCWEQSAFESIYASTPEFTKLVKIMKPFEVWNGPSGNFLKHALGIHIDSNRKRGLLSDFAKKIHYGGQIEDHSDLFFGNPMAHITQDISFREKTAQTLKNLTRIAQARQIQDLLDYTLLPNPENICAYQIREEFRELLKIIQHLKPKSLLEIGTCLGGSLYAWLSLCDASAKIIAVDMPMWKSEGFSSHRQSLYDKYKKQHQELHLIESNSHLPSTFDQIQTILHGESLDVLFIDGDHSYEGVKQDFNLYSPLVKPQGLIIFHDITTHPSEYQIDVSKFWNEIKGGFQIKEIQYPPKKTHDITVYGGIGIILKN